MRKQFKQYDSMNLDIALDILDHPKETWSRFKAEATTFAVDALHLWKPILEQLQAVGDTEGINTITKALQSISREAGG